MRWIGNAALSIFLVLPGCQSGPLDSWKVRAGADSALVRNPEFLEQWAVTRRFSAGQPTSITIVPDGTAVLFLRSGPRSSVQDLYEHDVKTGNERVLLTAQKILQGADEQLSAEERARRERMRMSSRGIVAYELSKDGKSILIPLSGRLFVVDRESGEANELQSEKGFPIDPRFSPDAKHVACVRDGELFVIDVATGDERQLTSGSSPTVTNGLAEFVAQEEMDRREGYWWSPDGSSIVYQQTSTDGMEVMHILDSTHPEKEPETWPYPRPGKKNADVRLGIVPIAGGETRWITWDVEKYPYLATVRWSKNAPLTILVQNREQTEEALLAIDADTGYMNRILLVEKDDAWLNLDQSMPKWFADGSKFLWTSQEGVTPGSNVPRHRIELRDRNGDLLQRPSGRLRLPHCFRDFVALDEARGVMYVTGGNNPTETHLYRVPLDGSDLELNRITREPGVFSATFSDDGSVHVLRGTTRAGRRLLEIRDVEYRLLGSLASLAEQPPFLPNVEWTEAMVNNPTIPGRDDRISCGNTTPEEMRRIGFHAAIVRPRSFSQTRRYPVLLSVYGGPGANTVTMSPYGYLLQQWIADHGFIVVSIDGRGTPGRGREWERTIKGNVIDTPLADQVDALHALARKYRELDMNRVGIYGWSFGGYFSAMAVMRRPDVFKAAVAGAPVADWLDYDTHYTERYMGLPDKNPDAYKHCSVLTHAKDLQNPLLVIHGTTDDNVYFMHSLKMSHELFRAGRKHEFLPLSGFTHMVADPLVTIQLQSRIVSFFKEHL